MFPGKYLGEENRPSVARAVTLGDLRSLRTNYGIVRLSESAVLPHRPSTAHTPPNFLGAQSAGQIKKNPSSKAFQKGANSALDISSSNKEKFAGAMIKPRRELRNTLRKSTRKGVQFDL
jgi:hypothetical protein